MDTSELTPDQLIAHRNLEHLGNLVDSENWITDGNGNVVRSDITDEIDLMEIANGAQNCIIGAPFNLSTETGYPIEVDAQESIFNADVWIYNDLYRSAYVPIIGKILLDDFIFYTSDYDK